MGWVVITHWHGGFKGWKRSKATANAAIPQVQGRHVRPSVGGRRRNRGRAELGEDRGSRGESGRDWTFAAKPGKCPGKVSSLVHHRYSRHRWYAY